jgi:D-alanyl-D-alanine carboxypeptidase
MRFVRLLILITVVLCLSVLTTYPLSTNAQSPQQTLDAIVREFVQDDAAIAVQVTSPDGTWTSAAGIARAGEPTRPGDRFRIASMSKTYVAALTLMLVDEGLFSLDDLASEWLTPDILENVANADQVTLRQLLAMRSGIPDYLTTGGFWQAITDDPLTEWTPQEAITYAYGEPALFAPDEDYDYSNSNYLLIQIVLETAAGEPLHRLMRTYILDPLGLDETYTQIMEDRPGGMVESIADFDEDGTLEDVSQLNDGAGLGDGGLVSTVADVTAFYTALLQNEALLSADSMADMLDFGDDNEGAYYGLGLSAWDTELGEAWGHTGAVIGFSSLGMYLVDEDIILVILSADESLDVDALAEVILAELFG